MHLPEFLTEWPDGEIVLTGHRITLYHVLSRFREGFSPERLAEEFPTLSSQTIEQVLAFYGQNQEEIDPYLVRYRADLEEQARQGQPFDLEELKRRLRARGRLGEGEWP
jgi:uncharacterized protein (DUF433 family)